MKGRGIHQIDGRVNFQPYGQEGESLYALSRALLNKTLIEEAKAYKNVKFNFNHECKSISPQTKELFFETANGKTKQVVADRIFAADGANSVVRTGLIEFEASTVDYKSLSHGYKELMIPADEDGDYKLSKNALHIWPRKNNMLIALPNSDGSFTATLFLPHESELFNEPSFNSLENNLERISNFFYNSFEDAVKVMPNFISDFNVNEKPSNLGTLYSNPWHFEDKVLLIGDAAHAVVPFYGQGMNAGFQDCTFLNELITEHKGDWNKIFTTFTEQRKPDLDSLAQLSLDNFIEMRDKVGDSKFLLQKEIERWVTSEYLDEWTDLHYLVTFTDTPYTKAKDIGNRQSEVMERIMADPDTSSKWKSNDLSLRQEIAKDMLDFLKDLDN